MLPSDSQARHLTRVLMLLENSPFSLDGRVKREARTLVGAGYQVCVICPKPAGGRFHERSEGAFLYQYSRLPAPPGALGYVAEWAYALLAAGALSLLVCARHGFDVVHAHNPPDLFFLLGGAYKLFGKKFVFDHHDLVPELYAVRSGPGRSALLERALRLFERLSCRTADHVIATNHSYAALERERGGVPPERITVVRNGPDPDRFRPSAMEARAHDDGSVHTIVYVGVVNLQDGVDHLIRALGHLAASDEVPPWRCEIVGSGDALEAVRAQAERLGIADRMSFTGWLKQPEVIAHLDAADVCVAPEPSNALNDRSTIIKVTEYMAMAKPCVAFDLPEHRYSAGEAALYARPNDDEDFARQIATLLRDPELRTKLGRIGRERVESMLSWEHQAPELLRAYRSLEPNAASAAQP